MKKTLAIVLTLLVAFSMFSVAASAASVQVVFTNGGEIIKTVSVDSGAEFGSDLFPTVADTFEADEYVDGEKKTYRYTFKGWKNEATGEICYPGTFKLKDGVTSVVLDAQYSKEDMSGRQSFWELVESIFARINLIFEYFARIFNF